MSAAATTTRPGRTSSTLALLLGVVAPALTVGGAWLAHVGALPPYGGFRLFLLSLPVSVGAVVFSVFALLRSRGGRNRLAAGKALLASTTAVVTLAAVVGLALPGMGFPIINDITTDTDDPPRFVAALRARPGSGNMPYPREFAAQQKRAYPGITTRTLAMGPEDAFEHVRRALETLRDTRIVDASKSEGRIEAICVSRVFRFTDDIVVRIRPTPSGGSRIDVRSRSRDGKGDLGVNAQRIDNLFTILR